MLGMIVDRSSFDETDDFGVDRQALETSEWSAQQKPGATSPVLRNGKVRRRLRWRPKSMMKKRRTLPATAVRASSSNASVASGGSKRSQKSLHSFASTETAVQNNTKKAQARRFPLPRPKFPDGYDAGSTIGVDRGTTTTNGTPVFEQQQQELDTLATSKRPRKSLFGAGPNSRRPPLPSSSSNRSQQDESTVGRTVRNTFHSGSSARDDVPGTASLPLPSLQAEDVDVGRRVDLRMRADSPSVSSFPSTLNMSPPPSPKWASDASRPQPRRLFLADSALSSNRISLGSRSEGESESDDDEGLSYHSEGEINESFSSSQSLLDGATAKEVVTPPSALPSATLSVRDLMARRRYEAMYQKSSLQRSPSSPVPRGGDESLPEEDPTPDIGHSKSLPTHLHGEPGFAPVPSPSGGRDEEFQFSMTPTIDEDEPYPDDESRNQSPSFGTSSKAPTVPVDVDESSFIDVEKNLTAIHDMATEHLNHGEYVEALEVFEEILRGQLARYGQDHYRVGTALHNIAIVHLQSGDYASAVKVCKEAVRVRKIALDPFHPDVADSLAQLGVGYMEENKYKRAIFVFREALRIRRRAMGPRHPKVAKIRKFLARSPSPWKLRHLLYSLLSLTCYAVNNIGCCLYEVDEWEVSMVAFQEALDIQRETLKHLPPDSQDATNQQLLSIASTLSNIGSIKLYWGLHDEAAVSLEEVLLIQQSVLGDDHPIARRTQESVLWVEKVRNSDASAPSGLMRSGTLMCVPGNDVRFNVLEAALNRLHVSLDFACGANGDDGAEGSDDDSSALTGMVTI